MRSPNPEVRILYRLGKVRKAAAEVYDPESLTEEGEGSILNEPVRKRNITFQLGDAVYLAGVVLNMHLHWKNHETVKVVCKPCKPGQIHEYADELTRLSKGIVIDIKPNNVIIFLSLEKIMCNPRSCHLQTPYQKPRP
ncbi:putative CRM domain-containing protein [Helianthus debilis subsp. tardiflorus]